VKRSPDADAFRTRTFGVDVLAWIVLLLLGVGGYLGWERYVHRAVLPADAEPGVADPRIVVLAYDRVVKDDDGRHVDAARFRDQLAALSRHGYRAITLDAARRFFTRQLATLPAKSVLLTFDHGYLSTVDSVDPVLREARWPAAMFVMTERQERRDPFFLYWPGLESMLDSGIWEVGSHGDQGHNPVVTDAQGDEGAFFLRRAFLREAGREETWSEYATRVRSDHLRARALLTERLKRAPYAYAPPLRDVAVTSLDPEVHQVYEDVVRELYDVAFIDDLFGVNDRTTDAHHVRRFRVGSRWTGEDLAEFLDRAVAAPRDEPASDEERQHLWIAATGAAQPRGPELVARGGSRADLWRIGSQWPEDWMLETDVVVDGGQFWVVQQSADLAEEWRWGGDERGTHLQRRRPAEGVETLASFPTAIEPGRSHHLQLLRRGTGVWVVWDGRPVSERPVFLPERWRGNVGLVSWGMNGRAEFRVRHLRFSRFPYRVQALGSEPSEAEVQTAIADAPTLSAVSPLWLELEGETTVERTIDADLVSILSRRYGWEVLPTVRVRADAQGAIRAAVNRGFAKAREAGWAGLRLEWTGADPDATPELVADLDRTASKLGLRLVTDVHAPGAQLADSGVKP
jgi:peptidoglycan/xylan/chitin deacetylase (PgdA/CDA1 family)